MVCWQIFYCFMNIVYCDKIKIAYNDYYELFGGNMMKEVEREDEIDIYYMEQDDESTEKSDDGTSYDLIQKDENSNQNATARNEFKKNTRDQLMIRAGLRCSNPYCRKMTVAFDPDLGKTVSIGEAAHIVAAKNGGPRNDGNSKFTPEYIKNIDNGLWLCASCHSMIDKPGAEKKYDISILHEWKKQAECFYINQISKPRLDFINSLKDDIIGKVDFRFEEATGLQIALVTYVLCEDCNFSFLRGYPQFDGISEGDYFLEEYEAFYSWITSEHCIKLRSIINIEFDISYRVNYSDIKRYLYWKSMFEDALLSPNMSSIVDVTKKDIKLDNDNVYKVVFNNDIDALETYLNKVLN